VNPKHPPGPAKESRSVTVAWRAGMWVFWIAVVLTSFGAFGVGFSDHDSQG
jgi:hypothetical protein